jgi:hypothetical protein
MVAGTLPLEPLHQPIFVIFFFQDRISQTICLDWLRTVVLLVPASRVARITGVSHRLVWFCNWIS